MSISIESEEVELRQGNLGQGNGNSDNSFVPIPLSDALPVFYAAKLIAKATGWSKKTVRRAADRDKWPMKVMANRVDFAVPPEIAKRCEAVSFKPVSGPSPKVRFVDLADGEQRKKVLLRQEGVEFYLERIKAGFGSEFSLSAAVMHAYRRAIESGVNNFSVGISSMERWVRWYKVWGIDGLVPQMQGIVGAKSAMSKLQEDDAEEFCRRGKALAIEHGSGGRANVARAAQEMSTHPDLAAPLREYLHGAHPSKSYVTPSIRDALTPSPLTVVLAQTGTRAARLSSSFTPGDWSQVTPRQIYCSDDMTSNIVCWCEWPNRLGYRLGQPQLLPVMAIGALKWLNFRLILRESGQYNAHDDIWGLFGDVFDAFGLPEEGFLLEGGHWQSDVVKGHRTGLDNAERIGGLTSLGLKIHRAWGPTGKAGIEQSFNQLQHMMDAFPGFIGREQRVDGVESVLKLQAECKSGKRHPSEFFPHISQLADHIQTKMGNMNEERNDGIILRGSTPNEKWSDYEKVSERKEIPDSAKWLYRSAMSIVKVTRSGIRVTQGSGAKLVTHYYDNAQVCVPRMGQRVVVYWNDSAPETDCVVLSANKPRLFLGVAKYVQPLGRFSATPEQLTEESKRKKASMMYARTELRSVQPELQRTRTFVPTDAGANRIGKEIAQANERADLERKQADDYDRACARVRARVRAIEPEDAEMGRRGDAEMDLVSVPLREKVPARAVTAEELEEL